MPFIAPKCRDRISKDGIKACEEVGDLCYVFYKHIVSIWKLEPRWRTVHRIYKDLLVDTMRNEFYDHVYESIKDNKRFDNQDLITALQLAWQVFFQNFVMNYENQKRDENGDIQ